MRRFVFIAAIVAALIPGAAIAQCEEWKTFKQVTKIESDEVRFGVDGGVMTSSDPDEAAALLVEAAKAMAQRITDPRVEAGTCGGNDEPFCNGALQVCTGLSGVPSRTAFRAAAAKP